MVEGDVDAAIPDSLEDKRLLAGGHVPQVNPRVVTDDRQRLAARVPGELVCGNLMLQVRDHFARIQIADFHRSVARDR